MNARIESQLICAFMIKNKSLNIRIMNLLEQINRIERLDQLIRMKATGTPKQIAKRLNVSRSTLYNLLGFMKNQGVEIYYCSTYQSFCYKQEVYFCFGFTIEKVQLRRVKGGMQNIFCDFFGSPEFLDWGKVDLRQQRC